MYNLMHKCLLSDMIGKIANGFTAILRRDHATIAVTTQQLSTYQAHDHCRAVSVGALEFRTPKTQTHTQFCVSLGISDMSAAEMSRQFRYVWTFPC